MTIIRIDNKVCLSRNVPALESFTNHVIKSGHFKELLTKGLTSVPVSLCTNVKRFNHSVKLRGAVDKTNMSLEPCVMDFSRVV